MRYKTLLKKLDFESTAYIYKNGIHIIDHKYIQKNKIELNYFYPIDINMNKKIGRIVIHDSTDLLPFGIPEYIELYENNNSQHDDKNGREVRTIVIRYPHGGRLRFSNVREKEHNSFHGSGVTIQGDLSYSSFNCPVEWYDTGLNNDYEELT